jgi:hypothetical protein
MVRSPTIQEPNMKKLTNCANQCVYSLHMLFRYFIYNKDKIVFVCVLINFLFVILYCVGYTKELFLKKPICSSYFIDENDDTLPKNYQGNNIVYLYKYFKNIDNQSPTKDEYETTENYLDRLLNFKINKLYHIMKRVYAMKLIHKAVYDADKRTLTVDGSKIDVLFSNTLKTSTYIGVNAFNVKKIIQSYSVYEYGLIVAQLPENVSVISEKKDSGSNVEGLLVNTIKMIDDLIVQNNIKLNTTIIVDPEKAKYLKNNIGVLLLFKPSKTGTLTSYLSRYSAATINNPSSYDYNIYHINIDPIAIWLYEVPTGKIIKKISSR